MFGLIESEISRVRYGDDESPDLLIRIAISRKRLQELAMLIKKRQKDRLVLDGAIHQQLHFERKNGKKSYFGDGQSFAELLEEDFNSQDVRLRVSFSTLITSILPRDISDANQRQVTVLEFRLGPYDFPFVDYFTIGENRYAFVLADNDQSSVTIDVIVYPSDYFEIQDRIKVDRLLGLLPHE